MWLRWLPWKYIVRRLAFSHGFVDPIAVLSYARRFAQPSQVTVPVELLRAGVVFHARGFINSRVIQQNLDWIWPYWIHRQFDPHCAAFIPRAFALTHVNLSERNWTAVGVPDCESLPIVDPRGLVTPFWDGWSLDAWVVTAEGRILAPSLADDSQQRLDVEGGCAVETVCKTHGVTLRNRVDVASPGEPVCRMTLHAESHSKAWLVVSARPYNPEGISFIHKLQLGPQRNSWLIEKNKTVEFSEPVDAHGVSHYTGGDVAHQLPDVEPAEHVVCKVGMATAAAMFAIEPGQSRAIRVGIPLEGKSPSRTSNIPAPAGELWRKNLANCCALQIADEQIQYLYDAAIRTLLLHSPGDVYPGPYTYKRFWFRDAAFLINAMLCAGMHERARRAIDRFFPRQHATGYFASQEGEWDSNGQVLWTLGRYCQLTATKPPIEWLKPIKRAARWIGRKRTSPTLKKPHAGLLPAGFSAEHLGPNDFYYWDDFWSISGLCSAAQMLRALDDEQEAERCEREATDLRAAVCRSLEHAEEAIGCKAIPASCYRRLDSGAIGSVVAGYPLQLVGAHDERLLATAHYLMDNCLFNNGFFQDMIHSGVNAYLTLHLAQVLLRAGDFRFGDLMQATADLASPTAQWPEAIHPRTHGGCMGDGQHVWASAEWVMMLRNCFVYEEENPERLVVGAGVLPNWISPGQSIRFGPTPTKWGPVRVSCEQTDETDRKSVV